MFVKFNQLYCSKIGLNSNKYHIRCTPCTSIDQKNDGFFFIKKKKCAKIIEKKTC